jgi:ABC-type uncharacterized transport system permease subunit
MNLVVLTIISVILYTFYIIFQWRLLKRSSHQPQYSKALTLISFSALIFHGSLICSLYIQNKGINLAFVSISVLISWVFGTLAFIWSLKSPIQNVFIFLFPVSIISLILLLVFPQTTTVVTLNNGLGIHIVLSILAYSTFSIASVHSILIIMQNNQLKHNHIQSIVKVLPSVQAMDKLLFDIISIGTLFLTLSYIFGWPYIENMRDQNLYHKLIFGILSLTIFILLLIGRYKLGWRGVSSSRWVLFSSVLLALAYLGSKFVLEFMISP